MARALATVGNVNVDLIMGPVDRWPEPGSEVLCTYDDLRVGGAAGNAALAWMSMGVPFQIAASTGDDRFGDWLKEAFGNHAARWPRTMAPTTISVGITHPGGERSFFSTSGHLPLLSWAEVETLIDWPRIAGGTLLLCGSFLMHALTAHYDALFDRAETEGITVALDTGWPLEGWTDATRKKAMGWVARSGIVLFNEVEATNLCEQPDPIAAAKTIATAMPEDAIVVVKLGPNGALAQKGDETVFRAAPRVDVRDTIGAGDVFNAGFLAALAENKPLDQALALAVHTASIAISTEPRRYILTMEAADEHA